MMIVLLEISGNQNHYSVIKRLNLCSCTGNFITDIQATFQEIICLLLTCPSKAGMTQFNKRIMLTLVRESSFTSLCFLMRLSGGYFIFIASVDIKTFLYFVAT